MGFIDKMLSGCKKWDPLVARILIGGFFAFAGFGKFMGIEGTAGDIAAMMPWLPMPVMFAYLAGSLEVLGGLSIMTGYYFRYGVSALAIFTVVVTVFFHADWSDQMQMTLAFKNACIFGALLYMQAYGPGAFALGTSSHTPPSPSPTPSA